MESLRLFTIVNMMAVIMSSEVAGYSVGSCPELPLPVGSHPSSGVQVTAGSYERLEGNAGGEVLRTVCHDSEGWILADTRFSTLRCSLDEESGVWSWSHKRKDGSTPLIRCSNFKPRPLEQGYTLHNYRGCDDSVIRQSLTSQISQQLETQLPCRGDDTCQVLSVSCAGLSDGASSKMSIIIESTLLADMECQREVLSEAANFLKDTFEPAFNYDGGVSKRSLGNYQLGNPFDDNDPDNSTEVDCGLGEITVTNTTSNATFCVGCTAGTYANKVDPNDEICSPCALDTYSINDKNNSQCEQCPSSKKTLDRGSDSELDCLDAGDVCEIPTVGYSTSSMPASGDRTMSTANVTIYCQPEFFFNQSSTFSVACQHLPPSCSKVMVELRSHRFNVIKAGITAEMSCNITTMNANTAGYEYVWYKRNATGNWTKDSFMQIYGEANETLTLENGTLADSGDYVCDMVISHNNNQSTFQRERSKSLHLSYIGVEIAQSPQVSYFVTDGLNLTCRSRLDSSGNWPHLSLQWSKGDNQETTINTGINTWEGSGYKMSELLLRDASLGDAGHYTCTGKYSINETSVLTTQDEVDVTMMGFTRHPEPKVSVTRGKSVELVCEMFLGPLFSDNTILVWEKGGIDINMNPYFSASHSYNDTDHISTSVLKFNASDAYFSDTYRCRLSYTHIYSHRSIVTVYNLGVSRQPSSRIAVVGESVEMSCQVILPSGDDEVVSVSWHYKDPVTSQRMSVPDNQISYSQVLDGNMTVGKSVFSLNRVSMNNGTGYTCQASYYLEENKQVTKESEIAELFVIEFTEELEPHTKIEVPFYYKDGEIYDTTPNSTNSTDFEEFQCVYHGDNIVNNVRWVVEDGDVVEFAEEGYVTTDDYNPTSNTLTSRLQLSHKFIALNYNATLRCQFHVDADNYTRMHYSETKFVVRVIKPLPRITYSGNSTVEITCQYVGTGTPQRITWFANGAPISTGDSSGFSVREPFYDTPYHRLRTDVLVVEGRAFSDPDSNIMCNYEFQDPQENKNTSTNLVFRGLVTDLSSDYYSTPGNNIQAECLLGVGANYSADIHAEWWITTYNLDGTVNSSLPITYITDYLPFIVNITTASVPVNGLFKSEISIDYNFHFYFGPNYGIYCSFSFDNATGSIKSKEARTHHRIVQAISYDSGALNPNGPTPNNLYGLSPEYFVIYCNINDDLWETDSPTVTWSGPNDRVINEAVKNQTEVEPAPGYNITLDGLNMTRPGVEDSGRYECVYEFANGPKVRGVFPNVQFNEIQITEPTSARVYTTATSVSVEFECRVNSPEYVHLGWFEYYEDSVDYIEPDIIVFNNVTNVTTNHLTLEMSSIHDRGTFYCGIDEVEYNENPITVDVLGMQYNFSGVIVGDTDDKVVLNCTLDYNKDLNTPKIEWFENDSLITDGISADFSSDKTSYVSELTIVVTQDKLNKNYRCQGTYNETGFNESNILHSDNVTLFVTQIVPESDYVVAAVGAEVELTCVAYSKKQERIYWRITENGSTWNMTDSADMVSTNNPFTSKSVLRYDNVSRDNSSQSIECWFAPIDSELSANVTLDVIDVTTTGREVVRGKNATLECSASATYLSADELEYKWYHISGREVPSNQTELKDGKSLATVQWNTDTIYTCAVGYANKSNSGDARAYADYLIFDFNGTMIDRDESIEVGDSVNMTCRVSNHTGIPSFRWYKEGSANMLYEETASNISTFNFQPTSYMDTGEYYCEVIMSYDGVDNGPFRAKSADVDVFEVDSSFEMKTMVQTRENHMGRLHHVLQCTLKFSGNTSNLQGVQWSTPQGDFSQEDFAEMLVITDLEDKPTYTSILNYTGDVQHRDSFMCIFGLNDGRQIFRATNVSLFDHTDLALYSYNPVSLNFTYTGEEFDNVKVTWFINSEEFRESNSTNTHYTPEEIRGVNGSTTFRLNVDMSEYPDDLAPEFVEGKIGYTSEDITYPDTSVHTTIYKREFSTELEEYTDPVKDAEKSFTCAVVAAQEDTFEISWFIGDHKLEESDNITMMETTTGKEKTSTLTIRDLNKKQMYNDVLRCIATWTSPEMFSIESKTNLDTYGMSMAPQSFAESDGSAVLTCLTWSDEPPKSVTWTDGDDDVVLPEENRIEIGDETIVTGSNDVHVFTLKFVTLQSNNQGNYTCDVVFPDDSQDSKETELFYIGVSLEPESPYFFHDVSSNVEFTCLYKGYNEPKSIDWYLDTIEESSRISSNSTYYLIDTSKFDSQLRMQKSVITITTQKEDRNGNYHCLWSVGGKLKSVTATMYLAVRELEATSDVFYSTDGTASMSCSYHYEGEETDIVTHWYKDSELIIPDDGRYTMRKEPGTQKKTLLYLEISGVTREDNGDYTCEVVESDGDTIRADTQLIVRRATIIADSSNDGQPLVFVDKKRVELQCQLEADKTPSSVQWFYKDTEIADWSKNIQINAISERYTDSSLRYFSKITLINPAQVDGEYRCEFRFQDSNPATVTVATTTVLGVAAVPDQRCVFLDKRLSSDLNLGWSFEGDIRSVNVDLKRAVVYLPNGKAREVEIDDNNRVSYVAPNVDISDSGVYRAEFTMDTTGYPSFGASQRLTIREAKLGGSNSTNRRKQSVVVGTKFSLTCNVTQGAQMIKWYDNTTELDSSSYETTHTTYSEEGLINSTTVQIKLDPNSGPEPRFYTCGGVMYDVHCPAREMFYSRNWKVDVVLAEPIQQPSDGYGYYGERQEFVCVFPDAGDSESKYNVYWYFNNRMIMPNGDYYEDGKRMIEGKILSEQGNNTIRTTYTVYKLDEWSQGEYQCRASWRNGVFIRSDAAFLAVRRISPMPYALETTNVAQGNNASLSCMAYGDQVADKISIWRQANGTDVELSGLVLTNNSDDSDSDEEKWTKGEVSFVQNSLKDYYFCKVDWQESNRTVTQKSGNSSVTSLRVLEPREVDVWGNQGQVVRMECVSDGVLRTTNGSVYRDERTGKPLYTDSTTNWWYKGPSETDWRPVDDQIKYRLESPWIGHFDYLRRSGIMVGPLEDMYADLEFKCSVNYQDDLEHNFYGGNVTQSSHYVLKTSKILEFEMTPDVTPVIVGDIFTLSCTAAGNARIGNGTENAQFRITNDRQDFDESKYEIRNQNVVKHNARLYTSIFEIQTKVPTALYQGQSFYCHVQFITPDGTHENEMMEELTVTTYYNCSDADVSVIGSLTPGQSTDYTDNEGDRTARVVCPDDTASIKYTISENSLAKRESVCTKETGYYSPPYLAKCVEKLAFTYGRYEQLWDMSRIGDQNTKYCTDDAASPFTKAEMTSALTTNNSACGPYPIAPCLMDENDGTECTLDVNNTGCSWDDSTRKLRIFYQVTFDEPVWTIQERRAHTRPAGGTKIKFWDCPVSAENPLKPSKRGRLLNRMVLDGDSDMVTMPDDKMNYSMFGMIGAGVIAIATLLGVVVYNNRRRLPKKRTMVIGEHPDAIEMTDRSTVVTNPALSSA